MAGDGGLDPEGYILPEADLAKVPPAYQGRAAGGRGAVQPGLVARFPFLPTAGVALTHLGEVRSARQTFGRRVEEELARVATPAS
jgi:hypothetical protein